jgi:hypothetical protein
MDQFLGSIPELLARLVKLRRESAFHTLVLHYAGLVHTVSKRLAVTIHSPRTLRN